MTLSELQQLKTDLSNGVIVSKATWLKVLDTAIKSAKADQNFRRQAALNICNAQNAYNAHPVTSSENAYSGESNAINHRSVDKFLARLFGRQF